MSASAAETPSLPTTSSRWNQSDEATNLVVTPADVAARGRLISFVTPPALVLVALAPAFLGLPGVLGVAGVAVIAALLIAARSPVLIALLAVALVPVTSGLARGLVVPGFRISEILILLGAAVVIGLPTRMRRRWTHLDILVAIYLALGTMLPLFDALFISNMRLGGETIQTLMGPVQFVLLYLVVSTCLRHERNAVMAQRLLLLASLPVSATGILEGLGPPAVHEFLAGLTETTAYNSSGYESVARAASVFPVWLALAGYLLVVLVLATALLLNGDRAVLPRWTLALVVLLGLLAIAASLTITIASAFAVSALYLGWRNRKLGTVVLLMVAGALAARFTFGSLIEARSEAQSVSSTVTRSGPSWLPETLGYRVQIWQDQYAGVLGTYAATGYGPGFPSDVAWAHTESGYITLLLRGGLPYLTGTGLLLAHIARRGRREASLATLPSRRALCQAAAVIAVLQVPINLTFPYFTASGLPQPAWILWALLAAQEGREPPAEPASRQEPSHLPTSEVTP